jgi:hypothetical protein
VSAAPPAAASAAAVGDVDATSLCVRFSFTQDALVRASQTWLQSLRPGAFPPKPPEFATYVHELTHYLQYVTTPYGMALHLLRLLQNQAAIDLIQPLLAAGQAINLPLSGKVPLPAGSGPTPAHQAYAAWWNLDYLIAALHGDTQRQTEMMELYVSDSQRVQAGQAPFHPELLDLRSGFAWAQRRLTDYVRGFNAAGVGADPAHPIFPDGIDAVALAAEPQHGGPVDFRDERADMALTAFGNPWDASAVIESAAVAAELFQSDVTYERLTAWLGRPAAPGRDVYRACLHRALQSINSRDINAFLLSYLTICEVALFPPLLPQHAALRGASGVSFDQLLPHRRFSGLLSAAGAIAPMGNRADRARYVDALIAALGWVHPDAIIQSAVGLPKLVRNPVAYLYQSAQQWRTWDSTAFIGVDALLASQDAKAEDWRMHFNFVVIDYADRTTYHRDKDFLQSMTTRYLETLGLQTVMRGSSLRIRAPYGRSAAETAWMTDWLRNRFAAFFPGIDFSALQFSQGQR